MSGLFNGFKHATDRAIVSSDLKLSGTIQNMTCCAPTFHTAQHMARQHCLICVFHTYIVRVPFKDTIGRSRCFPPLRWVKLAYVLR
jgi:hypothetical protein